MSDIAKVYAPGNEPAKGGQSGGKPYPNGSELSHNGNAGLAHLQANGQELTK